MGLGLFGYLNSRYQFEVVKIYSVGINFEKWKMKSSAVQNGIIWEFVLEQMVDVKIKW